MRTLYLLRSHGTAALDGEQLVVRSDDRELDRTPLPQLDQILVMGQQELSTPLIHACLGRGIPIAYLTSAGQCLGRLQPVEGSDRRRARRQSDLPEQPRGVAARALVAGTIGNSRSLLQLLTRHNGRAGIEQTLRRLGQLQGLAKQTPCLNQLRGLEGTAAATYFRGLGSLLEADGFGFAVRSRRPPLTPFDALCGFGYGVLWNALLLRVDMRGLDPDIGVCQASASRQAALVCDLIKPLRTFLVDPFHAQLIRAGQLRPAEHFATHGSGTSLNEGGQRLWLEAWSTFMAEPITLANDGIGPRWEVLDQLVESFARFVEDHEHPLRIPSRRSEPTL